MLKKLVLQHTTVAFLCKNKNDCEQFVKLATEEMHFSKTIYTTNSRSERFVENEKYILNHYFDKDYKEHKYYCMIINAGYEFQIYVRDYREREMYNDWYKITIIDFSLLNRKSKLEKINENYRGYIALLIER